MTTINWSIDPSLRGYPNYILITIDGRPAIGLPSSAELAGIIALLQEAHTRAVEMENGK